MHIQINRLRRINEDGQLNRDSIVNGPARATGQGRARKRTKPRPRMSARPVVRRHLNPPGDSEVTVPAPGSPANRVSSHGVHNYDGNPNTGQESGTSTNRMEWEAVASNSASSKKATGKREREEKAEEEIRGSPTEKLSTEPHSTPLLVDTKKRCVFCLLKAQQRFTKKTNGFIHFINRIWKQIQPEKKCYRVLQRDIHFIIGKKAVGRKHAEKNVVGKDEDHEITNVPPTCANCKRTCERIGIVLGEKKKLQKKLRKLSKRLRSNKIISEVKHKRIEEKMQKIEKLLERKTTNLIINKRAMRNTMWNARRNPETFLCFIRQLEFEEGPDSKKLKDTITFFSLLWNLRIPSDTGERAYNSNSSLMSNPGNNEFQLTVTVAVPGCSANHVSSPGVNNDNGNPNPNQESGPSPNRMELDAVASNSASSKKATGKRGRKVKADKEIRATPIKKRVRATRKKKRDQCKYSCPMCRRYYRSNGSEDIYEEENGD